MKKIAVGKAFYMQSKHVKVNYRLLTQIQSSSGAFADLPRSVSDAAQFYQAEDGSSMEKLFWSQYAEAEHLVPMSDQLKQMVELHKAADQAMKSFIVRLWPGNGLSNNFFGLVRQLVDACPRLEVVKRSVCIEGARRAFACVKLQSVKLDAVKLIKEGPPEGKEHRHPEMYYEGVLPGARLIANECSKDVIFE